MSSLTASFFITRFVTSDAGVYANIHCVSVAFRPTDDHGKRSSGRDSMVYGCQVIGSAYVSLSTTCLIPSIKAARPMGKNSSDTVTMTLLFCSNQFFHINSRNWLPEEDMVKWSRCPSCPSSETTVSGYVFPSPEKVPVHTNSQTACGHKDLKSSV